MALAEEPNDLYTVCLLGKLYNNAGHLDKAKQVYKKALTMNSSYEAAYSGLASVYWKTRRLEQANEICYEYNTRFPNSTIALNMLGLIQREIGNEKLASGYFDESLRNNPNQPIIVQGQLYNLNFRDNIDPQYVRNEHEKWAEHYGRPFRLWDFSRRPTISNKHIRLKIGMVSPDWKAHPIAQFTEAILRFLDRARFELFCYSTSKTVDGRTEELAGLPNNWNDVHGHDDDVLAKTIHDDGIDILFDLSGHTLESRPLVFARQPAPLQVAYLGYPCTTGMPTMHYRMTDSLADPDGVTDSHYTEKLIRISECSWCYTCSENLPPVKNQPLRLTFGSFNKHNKISDTTIRIWSKILLRLPQAKLYLKAKSLKDNLAKNFILKRFANWNIGSPRIEFKGWNNSVEDHLSEYNNVSIAVDTFPYHGTTTTCEAMCMGVPVITLAGKTHVSRVGVSLLTSVGLEEFIAETEDEYVEKAVALAQQPERLAELRCTLRSRMESSPLMDGPGFAKRFGDALEDMWRMHCEKSTVEA